MVKKNTPYNYRGPQMEKNSGVSRTVPDLTLSMRQILERHGAGLPINPPRELVYDDEDDPTYYPDPRTLDLAEIQQMQADAENEIAAVKQKLNDLAKQRKQAQIEAQQKAAREKAERERKEQEPPKNWSYDDIKAVLNQKPGRIDMSDKSTTS